MLEMGMDMEADLGNRFNKTGGNPWSDAGTIPGTYPKLMLPSCAEMRTLGQITDHMSSANAAGSLPANNPLPATKIEIIGNDASVQNTSINWLSTNARKT